MEIYNVLREQECDVADIKTFATKDAAQKEMYAMIGKEFCDLCRDYSNIKNSNAPICGKEDKDLIFSIIKDMVEHYYEEEDAAQTNIFFDDEVFRVVKVPLEC